MTRQTASELAEQLRDRIVRSLHLGHLRAGDRLPGVRETARVRGADPRTVAGAYRLLEEEGLVEVRSRSGVYIAGPDHPEAGARSEILGWLAGVLVEAGKRQVGAADLARMLGSVTRSRLRCALIESSRDHLIGFGAELREVFGIDPEPVTVGGSSVESTEAPPRVVVEADFLLTTGYHAPVARAWAEEAGKPLVIARIHPEVIGDVERRLQEGELTVVCVDPEFGARLRGMRDGRYADRLRVVLAQDWDAITRIRGADRVGATRAARERLSDLALPPLVTHPSYLSDESARELWGVLLSPSSHLGEGQGV